MLCYPCTSLMSRCHQCVSRLGSCLIWSTVVKSPNSDHRNHFGHPHCQTALQGGLPSKVVTFISMLGLLLALVNYVNSGHLIDCSLDGCSTSNWQVALSFWAALLTMRSIQSAIQLNGCISTPTLRCTRIDSQELRFQFKH